MISIIYQREGTVRGGNVRPSYMSVFVLFLFFYYNDTVQRHEQR